MYCGASMADVINHSRGLSAITIGIVGQDKGTAVGRDRFMLGPGELVSGRRP